MKRIVRLTESDLARIVRRVIRENEMIFEDYQKAMNSIATQLKPYGYKQEPGEIIWKGPEGTGSGVAYGDYDDAFHVTIKGKPGGNFKLGKDYDSSNIVTKVVSILKKY
jgi:hypothetical protein